MNDIQTQIAADNCEVLRARLAKYEDADGNPISTIAELVREVERLHMDYNEACADAMEVARELAALKAQPSGVVLPELRTIVTDAFMGMIAAVTSTTPPADQPPPPFIQSAIDRAVDRIGRLNSSPVSADLTASECACGDQYPANSYGAGFMAANNGVCENCDAANSVSAGVVDERAAFEAAVCERYGYTGGSIISRRVGDYYADASLSQAWALWQARAALTASAPNHSEQVQAWRDVLAERHRQITAEDFDASHDDMATRGQIAMAAGLYAIDAANLAAGRISLSHPSSLWPWPEEWWKPAGSRRNLIKAGALILAEIERLDRAAAPSAGSQKE